MPKRTYSPGSRLLNTAFPSKSVFNVLAIPFLGSLPFAIGSAMIFPNNPLPEVSFKEAAKPFLNTGLS